MHGGFWIKPCPVCGLWHDADAEVCEECGTNIAEISEMDNYTTKYMYDMFRSQAIRAYDREKRKIEREMRRIAKHYGMTEMYCSARFSNGECWYSKVPDKKATKHERVRYAAAQ